MGGASSSTLSQAKNQSVAAGVGAVGWQRPLLEPSQTHHIHTNMAVCQQRPLLEPPYLETRCYANVAT